MLPHKSHSFIRSYGNDGNCENYSGKFCIYLFSCHIRIWSKNRNVLKWVCVMLEKSIISL